MIIPNFGIPHPQVTAPPVPPPSWLVEIVREMALHASPYYTPRTYHHWLGKSEFDDPKD